jgi:hypothetical protein
VAIGPWDPVAAASRGRLRASDADREQVIDTLKAAFVQGLLTRDELDRRTARALAARTYAELSPVTAGLAVAAAGLAASHPPPRPVRAHRRRMTRKVVAGSACAIVLLPALVAAFLTFYGGFIILFLVACIGAAVSAAPPGRPRPGALP